MGVISDATDVPAVLEAAGIRDAEASRPARHPCTVTWDRLAEHTEKYADQFTPRELAAVEVVCRALQAIGNGSR